MLDLIFANRIYDIGHLYRVANIQEHITNLVRNNQPGGLSVVYQTYSNAAISDIANLNFEIKIMQGRG